MTTCTWTLTQYSPETGRSIIPPAPAPVPAVAPVPPPETHTEKERGYYVEEYLNFLFISRNLARRTIHEYARDLKLFVRFFTPQFESGLTLAQMEERHIREYLGHLRIERKLSAPAVNRKIASLKAYFKFLKREKAVLCSPLEDMYSLKEEKRLPKCLTESEVENLMDAVSNPTLCTNKRGRKEAPETRVCAAATRVLLEAGIKPRELLKANVLDVDLTNRAITIPGKRTKVIPLDTSAILAVQEYLAVRRSDDPALFVDLKGKRMKRAALYRRIDKKEIPAVPVPIKSNSRDVAIMHLLYATGMRIAELVALDLRNINFEDSTILVFGKGSKERITLMNESAAQALKNYLAERGAQSTAAVFLNNAGSRISTRAVQKLYKRYLSMTNARTCATPHTMRHSFATHLIENGADLMTVKELCGHESLNTTQIYANVSRRHIRDTYQRCFPRK